MKHLAISTKAKNFLKQASAHGFLVVLDKPQTTDDARLPHAFEDQGYDVIVSFVGMSIHIPTLNNEVYETIKAYLISLYGKPTDEQEMFWEF